MKHPIKFRMFLLSKLPSAYFAGVRIREIDEKTCKVTIPYKWFSQNPFRSTYFACLSMAAEMSTGALVMAHLHQRKSLGHSTSMLVTKVESEYFKKATGKTVFRCEDGDLVKSTLEQVMTSDEPKTIRMRSVGTNEEGALIAEFFITWSFKRRN